MSKSRKGSLSPLTVVRQTDFETVPATGALGVSMYSEGFDASDSLDPDPAIEHGAANARDPQEPAPSLVRAGGSIDVPMDFEQLSFWLETLLGGPDVTGSDPYTHVFESGKEDLVPWAFSAPVTDDHWKIGTGIISNTFGFSLNKEDGYKRASIGALAANVALVGSEPAFSSASPTIMGKRKAAGSLATFGIDGALVANITGGNFQYSNNASLIDLVDGGNVAGDVETGDASARTDITARLVQGAGNNDVLDRFTGKIADAFPGYIQLQLAANASLRLDFARLVGERRTPQIGGRQTLGFSAGLVAYPSADGSTPAVTFTLVNQTEALG